MIVRIFKNTLRLIKTGLKASGANSEQGKFHKYVKESVKEITKKAKATNDGTLTERHFLKIQWYMSNTLYLGHILANLVGLKRTKKEELAFMYLGAIIAFTDLLIDDYDINESNVNAILSEVFIENEENNLTDLVIEKIFKLYLKEGLKNISKSSLPAFKHSLTGLMKSQIESKQQFDTQIAEDEVIRITTEKGGHSFALVCSVYPTLKEETIRAMYKIGELDQFMNDSQDIYKDVVAGVATFVRYKKSYEDIRQTVRNYKKEAFSAIKNLPLPKEKKEQFLFEMHCLEVGLFYKLKCFEKLTGKELDFEKIRGMNKHQFRINPFTLSGFFFCYPRIVAFDYKN